MKRAAAAAISLMTGLAMLTGCSRAEVEETIQPLVADAIEESDSEAEAVKEEDESPLIPEIDTDIKIHAGSRIAVVSKCVKGEYWKMVKKGMEDAVKEINKAYGYKKDDQITMTFEGPDNEEDVETQINTIDAVIAENPDVLCISASDMDSCEAQLEAAKENGIPIQAVPGPDLHAVCNLWTDSGSDGLTPPPIWHLRSLSEPLLPFYSWQFLLIRPQNADIQGVSYLYTKAGSPADNQYISWPPPDSPAYHAR